MSDYYTALELTPDATLDEIKRSYKRLALRYHPDKAGPEGATKFKEIATAYSVLSDPQKRKVYDRFGATGVDAMDHPITASMVSHFSAQKMFVIALLIVLIAACLVIVFEAFLTCMVDGKISRPTWNYVKVFSPVFVIDVLLFLIGLLLFATMHIAQFSWHIAALAINLWAIVVQSILIPIAKDRNWNRYEKYISELHVWAATSVKSGMPPLHVPQVHYVQWRLWLIPSYVFCAVNIILSVVDGYSARKCKWDGVHQIMIYAYPISIALALVRFIANAFVLILVVLIACRADNEIKTNFYVVIGMPVYVIGALIILDFILSGLAVAFVKVKADSGDNINNNSNNNDSNENTDGGHASQCNNVNELNQTAEINAEGVQESNVVETSNNTNTNNTTNNAHMSNNATYPTEQDTTTGIDDDANIDSNGITFIKAYQSRIVLQVVSCVIVCALVFVSASLICRRENYYAHHHSYDGVVSLARSLIPVYILSAFVFLFIFIFVLVMMCCISITTDEDREL